MRPSPSSVLDRDLEIRGGVPVTQTLSGGGVQETFFRPFGPQFGLKIRGRGIRHCSSFFHCWPSITILGVGVVFLHVPRVCLLSHPSFFLFSSKWENNLHWLFKCTDRWILHDFCPWIHLWLSLLSGRKMTECMLILVTFKIRKLKILFVIVY